MRAWRNEILNRERQVGAKNVTVRRIFNQTLRAGETSLFDDVRVFDVVERPGGGWMGGRNILALVIEKSEDTLRLVELLVEYIDKDEMRDAVTFKTNYFGRNGFEVRRQQFNTQFVFYKSDGIIMHLNRVVLQIDGQRISPEDDDYDKSVNAAMQIARNGLIVCTECDHKEIRNNGQEVWTKGSRRMFVSRPRREVDNDDDAEEIRRLRALIQSMCSKLQEEDL